MQSWNDCRVKKRKTANTHKSWYFLWKEYLWSVVTNYWGWSASGHLGFFIYLLCLNVSYDCWCRVNFGEGSECEEKNSSADGDLLCDLCHGTAMRSVVWWTFFGKRVRGGNNMARASTMKCLFHHAPFISCVVFLLVTLKFLRSCFDNTKKKKRERKQIIRQVCMSWSGKARKARSLDTLLLLPCAHGQYILSQNCYSCFIF